MKNLLVIVSIAAFVLAVFGQIQLRSISQENEVLRKELETIKKGGEEEHYELAITMSRMQIHFNKLWFAGKQNNWELAGFYVHELEEALEDIIEHKVEDDGVDISSLAKTMTGSPLHELEENVKSRELEGFVTAYDKMMTTCNNCHQASNHGFIRVKQPDMPAIGNQVFELKD